MPTHYHHYFSRNKRLLLDVGIYCSTPKDNDEGLLYCIYIFIKWVLHYFIITFLASGLKNSLNNLSSIRRISLKRRNVGYFPRLNKLVLAALLVQNRVVPAHAHSDYE